MVLVEFKTNYSLLAFCVGCSRTIRKNRSRTYVAAIAWRHQIYAIFNRKYLKNKRLCFFLLQYFCVTTGRELMLYTVLVHCVYRAELERCTIIVVRPADKQPRASLPSDDDDAGVPISSIKKNNKITLHTLARACIITLNMLYENVIDRGGRGAMVR